MIETVNLITVTNETIKIVTDVSNNKQSNGKKYIGHIEKEC